jgi:hypothetical protein
VAVVVDRGGGREADQGRGLRTPTLAPGASVTGVATANEPLSVSSVSAVRPGARDAIAKPPSASVGLDDDVTPVASFATTVVPASGVCKSPA